MKKINSMQTRFLELFLVLFLFATLVSAIFYPLVSHLIAYQGCWIYEATGLMCPTCRGTRAMQSILRGNITEAINQNLLVIMAYPLAWYYWFKIAYNILRGRSLTDINFNLKAIMGFLLLAVLYTIIININYLSHR